ncbi:hypothetical protein [Kitasatospora sp. NPDC057936]|uniref:hypothetical protein n=1 Tax=Kitasatospora sp. NPDC057936 TaxID=3346283 RepID=UPI0036DF8445
MALFKDVIQVRVSKPVPWVDADAYPLHNIAGARRIETRRQWWKASPCAGSWSPRAPDTPDRVRNLPRSSLAASLVGMSERCERTVKRCVFREATAERSEVGA